MTKTQPIKRIVLSDNDGTTLIMVAEPVDAERPCYLVIRLESTEHWGDNPPYKYHADIRAVSPQWIGNKELAQIADQYQMDLKTFKAEPIAFQVEAALSYGTAATLWQEAGNNQRKLLKAAWEQIPMMQMMFGFYMDKSQNAVGDTGWDWIKGDLCGALKRRANAE
jgi:hypothetical protein